MSYIDDLIENGTNFQVRRGEGTASFTPVSGRDEDIEAFQGVVRDLRCHEGDGYSIHIDHLMSDRAGSFVDVVMITFDAK
ncbi:hypothetical protein ASG29_06610 [Sphingomonas sp. Leaf412]|uniref:hypothetical protein n=1 Tax=Sphingomonas sp. Leaf412 TaxID=1736370 RepID=UPI0007008122|nr:hypothetical protein [Sphingomonas sp. Leaf412]KQT33678.1 hypothetical protein ASG29_06610 [Sphingomonas sp. Leaf412]